QLAIMVKVARGDGIGPFREWVGRPSFKLCPGWSADCWQAKKGRYDTEDARKAKQAREVHEKLHFLLAGNRRFRRAYHRFEECRDRRDWHHCFGLETGGWPIQAVFWLEW